jgi:hypothetical protein
MKQECLDIVHAIGIPGVYGFLCCTKLSQNCYGLSVLSEFANAHLFVNENYYDQARNINIDNDMVI